MIAHATLPAEGRNANAHAVSHPPADSAPADAASLAGTVPLAQVRGLSKRFASGFALEDVDLTVPEGCVVGFVGRNGAGKTTTIRCLLGILAADAGECTVLDQRLSPEAGAEVCARARGEVGVVFDTLPFLPLLTMKQVVSIFGHAFPSFDLAEFHRVREMLGLKPRITSMGELSRGQGMQLQLALALAHHPRLLILDEATAGLDPIARDTLLELVRAWLDEDERRGVLFSSHITSDLEELADVVVGIDEGRITFALDKDVLRDVMGIARLTADELDRALASGLFAPGSLMGRRQAYSVELLVPNRRLFSEWFPSIHVEPATIDAYLLITSKGEVL